jgi:hypothetical protein
VTRGTRIALFGAITAAGTVAGGWWSVPILAAVWVRVLPSDRNAVATTMFGAAVGWMMLLGVVAFQGPVPAVAAICSAVLGLPRWGFPLVTLLFPAALAGTAAFLTRPAPGA